MSIRRSRRRGLAALGLLPLLCVALLWGAPISAAASGLELAMFESAACPYCRKWHEEVGGIYDRTPEGRAAPLRRIDIHAPPPPGLEATAREVLYTPTFVLLDTTEAEPVEVGRIAGYPGAHFFWPMLENLLSKAGAPPAPPGQ